MKKAILSVVLAVTAGQQISAQTFDEWFEQNKTQLKYLTTQILALEGYSSLLETGNGIAGSGLDSIAGIEQADEEQHADYFASLDAVSSAVASDPRVTGIRQYNAATLVVAKMMAELGTTVGGTLAANFKTAAGKDLAALAAWLMDGEVQLADAERLRVIGELYAEAQVRFAFAVEVFGQLEGIKK